MQKAHCLVAVMLIALLSVFSPAVALTFSESKIITAYSFPTAYTEEALDYNYTSCTIEFKINVVWNSSTTDPKFYIRLYQNTSAEPDYEESILITFEEDGSIKVEYYQGGYVTLGTGTYTQNDTQFIFNNGRVDVIANGTTIVDDFPFDVDCIDAIAYCQKEHSLSTGYVQLDIYTGYSAISDDTVNAFLPLILTIAMLGICLSFIKRVTR